MTVQVLMSLVDFPTDVPFYEAELRAKVERMHETVLLSANEVLRAPQARERFTLAVSNEEKARPNIAPSAMQLAPTYGVVKEELEARQ